MEKKIEELKKIRFFDKKEYKFENYREVLIKLAEYSPENIKIMYKPFTKKGYYYYGKDEPAIVDKIVSLTRSKILFDIDENVNKIYEDWKSIIGNENFEISNFGRIRKKGGEVQPLHESYYNGHDYSDGYLEFGGFKIHIEVAKAFKRVPELEKINYKGYEVHHINNNGHENTPDNLIWLTKEQHKIVHEITNRYSVHTNNKIKNFKKTFKTYPRF